MVNLYQPGLLTGGEDGLDVITGSSGPVTLNVNDVTGSGVNGILTQSLGANLDILVSGDVRDATGAGIFLGAASSDAVSEVQLASGSSVGADSGQAIAGTAEAARSLSIPVHRSSDPSSLAMAAIP